MSNELSKQTESQLSDSLLDAVNSGNHAEVDRLMAVEVEQEPELEVEEDTTPTPLEGEEVDNGNVPDPVDDDSDDPTQEVDQASQAAQPAAQLTEAQEIDNLRRELHRYKSDAGRVPHLQRKLQELERKLADPAALKPKPDSGTTANADDSIELPANLKKRIEDLKEIDPSLAEILEETYRENARNAQEAARSAESRLLQQRYEQEDEQFVDQQYTKLVEMIPQAPQVFKMPEWKQWKDGLSPARRAMAESVFADEVAEAIHAFAAVMNARQAVTPQNPVQTQTNTAAVDPKVAAAQEARDRKMNTAATVKTPAAKQRQQLDADAYFQEQYEKLGKEHHILK